MVRRALLVAALAVLVCLPAEGASPPVLRFPFWAFGNAADNATSVNFTLSAMY